VIFPYPKWDIKLYQSLKK